MVYKVIKYCSVVATFVKSNDKKTSKSLKKKDPTMILLLMFHAVHIQVMRKSPKSHACFSILFDHFAVT